MGFRHLATLSTRIGEARGASKEIAATRTAVRAAEQRLLGGG
jgi:hypothetical protein